MPEREKKFRSGTRFDVRAPEGASQVPDWRRGEPITAARLTEMTRRMNRNNAIASGQQIRPDLVGETFQVKVVEEAADFLVCTRAIASLSPTEVDEQTILVAKPYMLRRTPFHGTTRGAVTYDYDATAGFGFNLGEEEVIGRREALYEDPDNEASFTEEEYITPQYLVDDVLFVQRIQNGTGVFIDQPDGTQIQLAFIDLNSDGRAWGAIKGDYYVPGDTSGKVTFEGL